MISSIGTVCSIYEYEKIKIIYKWKVYYFFLQILESLFRYDIWIIALDLKINLKENS